MTKRTEERPPEKHGPCANMAKLLPCSTPAQLERADAVRAHPKKGDRIYVGGVPWLVLGRAGALPGDAVHVVIALGRTRTRKTLRIATWRRPAALAAVDVDGVRVAPPERPIDEDLEQADMFGEED